MSRPELAASIGMTALVGAGIFPMLQPGPAADVWFTIHWPRDLEPDAVVGLLRQVAAGSRPHRLVLEARASRGRITYRVGVPERDARLLPKIVRGWTPDVLIEPIITPELAATWKHAVELRLPTRQRPLRADAAEVARAIQNALAGVGTGTTVVQHVIGPRLAPMFVDNDTLAVRSGLRGIGAALTVGDRPLDGPGRSALRDKVGEHGFRIAIRVATTIPEQRIARGVLHRVAGAFRVAEGPGAHFRIRRTNPNTVSKALAPWRWPIAVNVSELVGLLGWPLGDRPAPGIERAASRRLPVPSAVPQRGRIVGDGNHPATLRPVAQDHRDALMHWHVLGPTGVGKSTLLANLVLADIKAGRGAVVIEPKGDLVADILARIPDHRVDDVVVLDPTDDTAVVGVNPLRGGPPDLIADQIMAVFRGLYPELGVRTADVLHAALLTLARDPDATIVDLPWLLGDARYRRTLTRGLRDDLGLGPFWDWYEHLSAPELNQVIAPVMNKVRPFLLRERIRRVLGQPQPSFDLARVFRDRTILLVPLSKGILGAETAGLLGSLVVSGLWQAAQARAAIPREARRPVTVVIDEFQDFLHLPTDLADVLAQARGLGLGLVLAHQHLGQLSPQVRAAVLANARSRVCFRLAHDDAAALARTTDLLDATDYQSLGRYEIYTSITTAGTTQPYCSATTRPLPRPTGAADRIRARSRERHARPIHEIDRELQSHFGLDATIDSGSEGDGPIGTRRRSKR